MKSISYKVSKFTLAPVVH